MYKLNLLRIVILLTLSLSCAGPMTPFGSIELIDLVDKGSKNNLQSLSSKKINQNNIKIRFNPGRLNLHENQNLKIRIEDQKGIKHPSSIHFYYNGMDITKKVYKLSNIQRHKNVIIFSIRNMAFLAINDHNFSVTYERDPYHMTIIKNYLYPICPIKSDETINQLPRRLVSVLAIEQIKNVAKNNKMNPNFIAGLIQQESSFNSNAVSTAKAIGLTQITSIAEKHIIKKNQTWPQYPNLKKMNYSKVKSLIKRGDINSKTEWRLDSEKSILGGVEYLKYLTKYWSINENQYLLKQTFGEKQNDIFEDIILASYNSGAFRVKTQIIKSGHFWKESKKLKEAKKYIRKVKSYCYQFSGREL